MVALAASLAACGPAPFATPPPSPPAPRPVASGFEVTLPPLLSPSLAAFYEERARRFDPRNLFVAHEQVPPPRFAGIATSAVARFPGARYATVRAYEFYGDQGYPNPHRLNFYVEGCRGGVVARDGTLCPSVVFDGAPLSAAQIDELLAITREREPKPIAILNGFQMTHAFVFFDAKGAPVGQILAGADLRKMATEPPSMRDMDQTLGKGRAERLRRLLAELGLYRPIDDATDELLGRQAKLDGEVHAARWLPPTSGVDPSKSMRAVSATDRRMMCAWYVQTWAAGTPRSRVAREGNSIECPRDGSSLTGLDWQACQQRFPSCTATVGEVEGCMRRQRFDPCLERAPRCKKLRDCFWGMVPMDPAKPR